jgi:hypothetical protein
MSKGKENICLVCVDDLSAATVMIYHEVTQMFCPE